VLVDRLLLLGAGNTLFSLFHVASRQRIVNGLFSDVNITTLQKEL